MPYRRTVLAPDQFYHILNRGVAGLPIFLHKKDYLRFIELVNYYRFTNVPTSFSKFKKLPLEERSKTLKGLEIENNTHIIIYSFCLMPNHFHLLLKQVTENGIRTFLSNLQNGFAKYHNIKNDRNGPLFQSTFKAVRVDTDDQLLHVSRYIHLNPTTSFLVRIKDLSIYPWSSLPTYIDNNLKKFSFIDTRFILGLVGFQNKYGQFILDQADYQRELDKIKHLSLE